MNRSVWNRMYRRGRSYLSRQAQRRLPQRPRSARFREALYVEELETRVVPALPLPGPVTPVPLPLPNPLVPDPGDQQILDNVLKMAVSNRHVLNDLPVPFVIVASAGGAPATVTDGHSHAPVKIDADQSEATGQGGSGFDIQLELDAFVDPVPHLVLTIDRLGDAPFATNLSVVIAFPFAGFDLEPGLPSTPNLVMGFQTRAAGDTPGGHAPLHEVITLTPGILAGTSHTFTATMSTTGADNPLSFILGNLDGTNLTGTLNAAGFRAYVENVPATINTTVTTSESALATPVNSSFDLIWQASSASLVKFDYLENLTNPAIAAGPDFNTSMVANQMPTNEQFALAVNEPGGVLTLSQHGNAGITAMTFQKTRSDGLAVVGNGAGVPTQVDVAMNLAGSATLTDNANVGSFAVQASKAGGFAGSSSFLGYNVGTVGLAVTNAPSLSAGLSRSGTDRVFTAAPAVAGNVIGSLEFLASSDSAATVQLPAPAGGTGRWSNPAWDVLSMVDTGTADTAVPAVFAPGATAAARLLNLKSVQFIQHTPYPTIGSFLDLVATTATPLQVYLRTTPTSQLIPSHDIEITCEIVNVPAGEFKFTFNGPTDFGYTTNPPTGIDSLHCFGHIDTLAFDIDAGGLPPVFAWQWDPDSHLNIKAEDGFGGPAFVGHLAGLLSDPNGISLFADAGVLFGPKLKKARVRVDSAPSLTATWVATDGGGNTAVHFDTKTPGLFAGGIQFASSTNLTDAALANPLTPAPSLTADYATFNDAGAAARDMLVGVLGIDSFSYVVTNASDIVHIVWDDNRPVPFNLNVQSITGGVYFAHNKVFLSDTVARVPSHLDYTTNLDYRQVLTGTDFIPFLDLTFDKNQGLPNGCTLTVHADTLPPVTVFDYEPALGTFSILAQDLAFHDTQKFGDVLLDLECPSGLPGTDSLLGAKVEQARLRLDNVPSFTGTYATAAAGTTIGLMSVAPGLSIGATQLQISTAIDLAPPGPPTGGDADTVTLSDPGGASAKHLVAQLFGLTNFNYATSNAANSATIVMAQDAARKMVATVVSNNGAFFKPHNVNAAITIDQLPTSITLTSDWKSSLSYTASSDINSITVGGSGGAAEGFFDTTKFSLSATGLPANLSFAVDPASHVTLTVSPHSVGNITAHLHDPNGFGGGSTVLLGDALRDARLRLDSVPSLNATWSGAAGTSVNFDATNAGTFLGGAQVALSSTENDTVPPFASPGPSTADYVKVDDEGSGNVKRVATGLFGIGHFALSTQDATHGFTIGYAANAAREFKVNVDSNFGHFFSTYNIHAVLDVQNVPATWSFSSDFATALNYTASSGIGLITVTADINKTTSAADNTHAQLTITGLPDSVNFALDPSASATLTMSHALTEIKLIVKSDNTILGTGTYRLVQADLNNIPAHWSANWSGGQFVLESKNELNNPAPMGTISGLISTSDDGPTNVGRIAPFMTAGDVQGGSVLQATAGASRIDYSTFSQEVDARYYNASGAPSVFSRLRELYADSKVLGSGEDHAVAVVSGGKLQLAEFQFTGFQKVAYQPNANGGHYELDVPNPSPISSPHRFFAGAMLDAKGVALQIQNIPGTLTLDIDTSAHNIHFHSDVSAGQIDAYYGPLPEAHDGDTAVRAVMDNTPSDVQITWTFGFPNGNAQFKASNPFSLNFLAQSGGTRVIGGLSLMNLELNYGLKFPDLSIHIDAGLIPPHASVDLDIISYSIQVDNGTGGVEDTTPGRGVSGFAELYEHRGVSDLVNPAFANPGGDQFVPLFTFMMKNFTLLNVKIAAGVQLFPSFLSPEVHVDTTLHGQFSLDYWFNDGINFVKHIDYLIGSIDIGLVIPPSYQANKPIFLIPFKSLGVSILHDLVFTFTGFGDFSDHFDPFSGMMLASSAGGGASDSDLLTDSSLAPALDEALSLWLAAGIDPTRLDAALNGARIVITHLPGRHLGLTDPETHTIWIDQDAAGWGWFIDPTPGDNSDFTGSGPSLAQGRMDLVTLVTHEVGHLLGFDDVQDSSSIMSETLQPGERLIPTPQPGRGSGSRLSVPALPELFVGLPFIPVLAPNIVGDSYLLPAQQPAPPALTDRARNALLDAAFARLDNTGSDYLAPAHVFALAEQLPPDDGGLNGVTLNAFGGLFLTPEKHGWAS